MSLVRGSDLDGPALPEYLPAVGVIRTGDDLHQGGLARTIFAYQRVNLAGTNLEAHVIKHRDAAERLGDMFESQQRLEILSRQSLSL
jgi:hypothetical protein